MQQQNSQPNRPLRSSSGTRSVRAAKAVAGAQAGASQQAGTRQHAKFSQGSAAKDGYKPVYSPGSQSRAANQAFARQASQGKGSQYARNNPQYAKAKRKAKGKSIAAAVLAVVLLLALGGGTAFALYVNNLNTELAGAKTKVEQKAIDKALAPVVSLSDPFYMLLLGSDAREDDEEMGERTDTNILVYVNPKESYISMVSIPRDTKINIEGYGTNKFNAAYTFGGTAGAIKAASDLCGVNIAHYAEVNFESLIALVDTVGGIEVEVAELIDDPDAGNVVIQPGLQTLNGEAALVLSRSRAYADGDFTRTTNQRLVVEALIKKILSMPATDLPGIINTAAKSVTTDMTANDLLDLAMQFKDLKNLKIYSAMVPSTIAMINEISYVVADTVALKEMMALVEAGKDPSTVVASGVVYSDGSSGSSSGYGDTSGYGYQGYEYSDSSGTGNTDPGYVDPGYVDPVVPDNGTGTGGTEPPAETPDAGETGGTGDTGNTGGATEGGSTEGSGTGTDPAVVPAAA